MATSKDQETGTEITEEVEEVEGNTEESISEVTYYMFRENKILSVFEKASADSEVVGKILVNEIIGVDRFARGFAHCERGWFKFNKTAFYELMS